MGWFMVKKYLILFLAVFLLVVFVNAYANNNSDMPSPFDRISEEHIKIYSDRVIIYINNPEWAGFDDTNSMDPVIDKGANAIQIIPESTDDIHVGDIISYESEYADGVIIHRVISIGSDEEGWYCIAKGDNNPSQDPGKIRFNQIKKVLVAIIY